jgi:hypothetical protein
MNDSERLKRIEGILELIAEELHMARKEREYKDERGIWRGGNKVEHDKLLNYLRENLRMW